MSFSNDDDAAQVMGELTELLAGLATGQDRMLRQTSALLETQRMLVELLDRLEARVSALEAAPGIQAALGEHDVDEAVRQDARQALRRTQELLAESERLVTNASSFERDASAPVTEGRTNR